MSPRDLTDEEKSLIKPERRHLVTLRKRIQEIDRRVNDGSASSFVRAEREALAVAVDLMDLHFAEQSIGEEVTTSALLHEAAELAAAHNQPTIAARLKRRAQLLDEQ